MYSITFRTLDHVELSVYVFARKKDDLASVKLEMKHRLACVSVFLAPPFVDRRVDFFFP